MECVKYSISGRGSCSPWHLQEGPQGLGQLPGRERLNCSRRAAWGVSWGDLYWNTWGQCSGPAVPNDSTRWQSWVDSDFLFFLDRNIYKVYTLAGKNKELWLMFHCHISHSIICGWVIFPQTSNFTYGFFERIILEGWERYAVMLGWLSLHPRGGTLMLFRQSLQNKKSLLYCKV